MSTQRLALLTLLLIVLGLLATPPPADAAGVPTCHGRRATIVGTAAGDFLVGTPRRDVIVGRGGDDQIRGRGGDDVICGGPGSDRIFGGAGDDRLYGDADRLTRIPGRSWLDGDHLDGGPGDDRLDVGHDRRHSAGHQNPDEVAFDRAPRGVRVSLAGRVGTARGQGRDRIVLTPTLAVAGSPYDDVIVGSAGDDHVTGNAGDDVIRTGPGDDTVYAETYAARPGDDLVDLGTGDDLAVSAAGRDRILGGWGNDTIEASGPEPVLVDAGGDDDSVTLTASRTDGTDVRGGDGADFLLLRGWSRDSTPRPVLAVDLRVDGFSFGGGGGRLTGFEVHHLTGDVGYEFHGTDRPDRVMVLAGGGLRAWTYGGDDIVVGSEHDDLLDLGDGDGDEGYGVAGTDTCSGIEIGGC